MSINTVKLSNLIRTKKKSNRMRQEMIRMIGWYGWYPSFDSISIWHALYSRVSL